MDAPATGSHARVRPARSESPLDQHALQANRFGLQLQQGRLLLPKGSLLLHQLMDERREVVWTWHPRQVRARSAWWSTAVASARRWAPTPDRAIMVSTHTFVPVASSWASRPRATRNAPSRNTAGCPRRW